MCRSRDELEELVRALEFVWIEQSGLAQVYQQEAAGLGRIRLDQDLEIVALRREIDSLRAADKASQPYARIETGLAAMSEHEPLQVRIARQRESIAERKRQLAQMSP